MLMLLRWGCDFNVDVVGVVLMLFVLLRLMCFHVVVDFDVRVGDVLVVAICL